MHTFYSLLNDLRQLGINSSDYLTVHTSLKKIGEIEAEGTTGAEVFISALKASVNEGLLMIPTHTFSSLANGYAFDVRNSQPCIGAVPTVAAQLANLAHDRGDDTCVRSLHPTHSVVAFGKDARAFTDGDRFTTKRMDEQGSYCRLWKKGGKILLAGVGLINNTFIHLVEELYAPETYGKVCNVFSIDYDGVKTPRQVQSGGLSSYLFGQYQPVLDEAGAIIYGKIGDADAMVCDARKTYDAIVKARQDGFCPHAE